MRKILTFVLGICLIIPCLYLFTGCKKDPVKPTIETWDGSYVEVSQDDNGVILIETAEELAGLAREVKNGNSFEDLTIKLTCDMDLTNKEWTPIGFGSSDGFGIMDGNSMSFAGKFDGQNHKIHNLKITTFLGGGLETDSSSGGALFGHVTGEVKNITVINAEVVGNHFVGAVVGFASGAKINNCHVLNANISCVYENKDESGDKAGAIAGYVQNSAYNNGEIRNCSAKNSTVLADRDAGQVLGCLVTNDYGSSTYATESELKVYGTVLVAYEGENLGLDSGKNISNQPIGRDER